MAKRTVDDLDFELDDNGQLIMTGYDEGDEFEDLLDNDEEKEEEEDDDDDGVQDTPEEEEEDEVSLGVRVGRMEATINSLPDVIAQAFAKLAGSKKEEDEEGEIPEELDSKQIVSILSKRMDKAINGRLETEMGKYRPALQSADYAAQFQTAAAKYGQSFVNNAPLVSKIMVKSNGALNVEQAWDILKSTGGVKRSGSREELVTKTKRSRVDADSKDAIGELPERTPFKKLTGSDSEVFEKAFKSSMISHARAGRGR